MHQGKKALVTGAAGFIGSHLCELLLEAGYDVTAFVRYNSRNHAGHLESLPDKNAIKIIAGDIRDADSVMRAVAEADVVCHLAALIGIPYSYLSPLAYVRTNIEGTYNILESARVHGSQKVIITSTSETYGTAQYTPIDENHPAVGQSPYSATKIAADQLAISYHRSFDLPVVVLRPFNTYGPRQSARAVIPTIIGQLQSGAERLELGDISPTRDLTYVTDTCRGFLGALESDQSVGREINLGYGAEISIKDLAEKIMKIVGKEVEIIPSKERMRPSNSEVKRLLSDNNLARELLAWEPRVSLEEGLQEVITFLSGDTGDSAFDRYIV